MGFGILFMKWTSISVTDHKALRSFPPLHRFNIKI